MAAMTASRSWAAIWGIFVITPRRRLSAIDAEIKHLVNTAYERTESILKQHMDKLQEVAQFLFQHEKMSGEEFRSVMEGTASFLRPEAAETAPIPSEE